MDASSVRRKSRSGIRQELSRGAPTDTKHHLIANDLRRRVRKGEFGDLIPGQRVLAARYGVNFLTVRKAVATLVKEGLLVRQPGRGTFVTRLQRERTHSFAVIYPASSHGQAGWYSALLQGLQEESSRNAHDLLLRPHDGGWEMEEQVTADIVRREKVDGVFLWPTRSHGQAAVRLLRRSKLPFVTIMCVHAEYRQEVSYVVDDDFRGGYEATKHLLDLGHRKIGYLGRAVEGDGSTAEEERWRGCRQAQIAAGIAPGPRLQAEWLVGSVTSPDSVSPAFLKALRGLTALFCMGDRLALVVLHLQKALDLRIPEDISLVGYDDMEAADLFGLTTMRQPMREIGIEAARVLLAEIEAKDPLPQARILEPRLIVRSTTAPPPVLASSAGGPFTRSRV